MQPLVHQEALMMQRMLKVLSRRALPDRKINLGDFGDIALVTTADSVFPRFS